MARERQSEAAELRRLADRLILRHLRVSVPETGALDDALRDHSREPLLDQRVRCIAVVGAGASAPLLARGNELARRLEEEFDDRFLGHRKARREELYRLRRVYGLDPGDFETRLTALSRTPEITHEVRTAISRWYDCRHPTILSYELLAHLLKHRFLDAIISFNFDELLDQSLDDELGQNAYRRLVSDRDCVNVIGDPDDPEYLPLYLKLHGTAAEPDSLRLTREAYYKLPQKLMRVVNGLLESQLTVVVNVGSAMTGFDLHQLLRIPQRLEIFDLSPRPIAGAVREEITAERCNPHDDSPHSGEARDAPTIFPPLPGSPARGRGRSCNSWMKELVRQIERRCGANAESRSPASLVRFRSVERHEAVADVLGPEATLSRWIRDPEAYRHEYVEYLEHRTVLELAFSGAKARGLGQLSWLATDRCGTYYDLYKQRAGGKAKGWAHLRRSGGLDENTSLPDVVESQQELCRPGAPRTLDEHGNWSLREFVPESLADHVVTKIGKGRDPRARKRLARALKHLQAGSEVEIHATGDEVCAKAFDAPLTLPTTSALSIFTNRMLADLAPSDRIYISCETGEWLLSDERMLEILSRQEHVEVLTAFDFKFDELRERFGERLTLAPIPPWRHNRHMTIVCHGTTPQRAVYFARRLRTPIITPVYLDTPRDARRVMKTFELMRIDA